MAEDAPRKRIVSLGRSAGRMGLGLTARELRRLHKRVEVRNELNDDLSREQIFVFSESLSNFLFSNFINHKYAGNLKQKVEDNTDHGFSHTRRLEKLAKDFNEKDNVFRRNKLNQPYFLFAPSLFLSMRFHDLFEIPDRMKKGHAESAALLTLGLLMQFYQQVNRFSLETTGRKFYKSRWRKIAWATAITCLYHSNPTLLPELSSLKKDRNGRIDLTQLIDVGQVLRAVRSLAKGGTIYDMFPPFKMIRSVINNIEHGTLQAPHFTDEELKGLYTETYLFAAFDKIDSIDPPDFSSARTLQSKPKRVFYQDIRQILQRKKDQEIRAMFKADFAKQVISAKRGKRELTVSEDLLIRVTIANSHDAPDDYSRYLFELQRAGEFSRLASPWVLSKFKTCLIGKGNFLAHAIPQFLEGNFSPFTNIYAEEELAQIEKVLKGLPKKKTLQVLENYRNEKDNYALWRALTELKIEVATIANLFNTMEQISRTKDEVETILGEKYRQLGRSKLLGPDYKDRMRRLFQEAIDTRTLPVTLDMRADSNGPYFAMQR